MPAGKKETEAGGTTGTKGNSRGETAAGTKIIPARKLRDVGIREQDGYFIFQIES